MVKSFLLQLKILIFMLKKELIGSVIYSKELGINIEVEEKNIEVLKSIKADVFENDKPKEANNERNSTYIKGKNND